MKTLKATITFLEEVLGTGADPEVHKEFIAAHAPDAPSLEEEVAAVGAAAVEEKGRTRFARTEDGTPMLWDYQLKGFLKDACGMLARVPGSKSNKLKAYKKVIDGLVFVQPRMIPITMPAGTKISICERPLRAQTAQGERVALASSEAVPAGSTITCELILMDETHEALVREWLDYGILRGIGQWRNSGKGRFSCVIE